MEHLHNHELELLEYPDVINKWKYELRLLELLGEGYDAGYISGSDMINYPMDDVHV